MTVITVTYRSAETIERCLRSIAPALGGRTAKVVVVDNASDDGTVAVVRRVADELPVPVELVVNVANVGFSAGCNQGLAWVDGPWVLYLNPDAEARPGAIDALVDLAAADPGIGILAPALIAPDGDLQATVERTHRLGRVLAGMVRIGGANRAARPPADGPPVDVPWVWAAVILMPSSLVREIGGFDERYFLYGEDMDICTRVQARGRRVAVAPTVRFHHVGGASASLSGGEPVAAARRVQGLGRYLELHQGAWARAVFAVAAVALYGVASLGDALRRRRPSAHWAMTRAAWRLLAHPS